MGAVRGAQKWGDLMGALTCILLETPMIILPPLNTLCPVGAHSRASSSENPKVSFSLAGPALLSCCWWLQQKSSVFAQDQLQLRMFLL